MERTGQNMKMGMRSILLLAALMAGCVTNSSNSGLGVSSSGAVGAVVDKPIDGVNAAVQTAFDHQGVALTESKRQTEGDKRTIKGKKGDLDVTVDLSYNGASSTKVDVSAREHLVTYDKTFAQGLLDDIIKSLR